MKVEMAMAEETAPASRNEWPERVIMVTVPTFIMYW